MGGRVYPAPTRNHPAWRGTRRARRPRAHGSAEAPPAQHHCTLRARSLVHSSLDAVQCGVAIANHHCSNTANICTTPPFVHIARLHLPCKCRHSCLQITAQPAASDLASLLCFLLCYTLTSLLCTSCGLLRSGTLEQPSQFGMPSASVFVLEYRFGTARPSPPSRRTPAGQ